MKKTTSMRLMTAAVGILLSIGVNAIPAKRGIKRTITLTDGTSVEVTLQGDEHFHYYTDAQGNNYIAVDDEVYEMQNAEAMQRLHNNAAKRKAQRDLSTMRRVGEVKDKAIFRGQRKGLIILANFTDKKFSMDDPQATFNRIVNERGYNEGNFKGSVRDYFYDNSYGKFDLEFDVLGPIELANNIAYYGQDQGSDGNDIRPAHMIKEALEAVADKVNFRDYDWDGDNEVDQVFVIYAGYNQAQGAGKNTIWPHMWQLQAAFGEKLVLNGVTLNNYACSSELANATGTSIDGIGTICHEFSHCMGFPDLYDTQGSNFGMSSWDLMSSGNYNGDSFSPAAYTSYERMVCGWLTPIELTDSVNIKGMKGLTEGGESYIIYGDNPRRTEYYLLENRQPVSWDEGLPGKGMLILHVDYDKSIWEFNMVNAVNYYNGHQRCTIFHADNNEGGYYKSADAGDPYPYRNNNSWTSTSVPAAIQYNGENTRKKLENREVTDITLNDDGTIDFRFRLATEDNPTYRTLYLNERSETAQKWDAGVYNIHTNRLFASNEWETLWLPFAMSNEQVKSSFGRKAVVAVFTGADEEGGILNFEVTSEGIPANTPVLIKVSTSAELNDIGNLIQMNVTADDETIEIEKDNFKFIGSRIMAKLDDNSFYVNKDYFANTTIRNNGNGEEDSAQVDEETTSEGKFIRALQAYIKNENINRPALKISIDGEIVNDDINNSNGNDPDPNSINEITEKAYDNAIYNLQGVRVNKANLGKGIYIINGKKIIK